MSSTITALTSGGGLAMAGDTSGVLELKSANGAYTATVPQATGTVMVSGNMPAFSAYLNADQAISSSTATKVLFDVKEYDTANNFSTANSRFTPTVAGYYLFTSRVYIAASGGGMTNVRASIYKNGASVKNGNLLYTPNYAVSHFGVVMSAVIYMNGSTDYAEVYGYSSGVSVLFAGTSEATYFQATLLRTA